MDSNELLQMLHHPHSTVLHESAPGQETDSQMGTLQSNIKGLVVMLHGWDLFGNKDPGLMFQPAVDAARQHFQPRGYAVLAYKYNTHESFVFAGNHVCDLLRNAHYPLDNVHFFGYSMGGLVARQAVVNGINPRSLITYCTPNLGTAAWVSNNPLHMINNGAMSMSTWSQDLKNLNNHPRDKQFRHVYQAIGLSHCKDAHGKDRHMNDGIVELTSAMMWNTEPKPAAQHHWDAGRSGPMSFGDPHGTAQSFPYIGPALQQFYQAVKA